MTSPEHTLRGKLIQALNGAMPTPDDAIAILNRWDELVAERDELTRRLKLEYETRMDTRKMLEAAEAERDRYKQAYEILRDDGGWGHSHWDHTMQHGAGCETCIEQREAKARARAALNNKEQP